MPARMARLLTPASGTRPPAPTAPRDTPFEPLLPRSDRRKSWSRSSLSDGERLVTGTSRGLPRQGRGHLIEASANPPCVPPTSSPLPHRPPLVTSHRLSPT